MGASLLGLAKSIYYILTTAIKIVYSLMCHLTENSNADKCNI